jgi:hypothetical protein
VQRAPGRGRRARGAALTFRCLQISRGRCSAWLGHVSPRTLASLARHGALRAGHPWQGSSGSRGGRRSSGELAGCAPAACPSPLRPAQPGRPPRRSSRPSGSAQRRARGGSGEAGTGDARALACSRRGGASHSHPASYSSDVLIYCNCLRRDLDAGARRRGRRVGGSRREQEGSPCSRSRVPATPRSRAAGGEGAGSRAPASCALGWHQGGRSPGPRAGVGAGAARGRAWPRAWGGGFGANGGVLSRRRGCWRRRRRRWKERRRLPPCAGLHRGASSGFLGCRRRCEAQELVESTLELPPHQLEIGTPCFLSGWVARDPA